MLGLPKTLVQAWILNLRVTVVWAPTLPFSPARIPILNPGRALLPDRARDPTKEPMDDNPLSDQGEGDGDQEMPDANKQHSEQQGANDPTGPGPAPDETQEGAQPGDDQMGAGDGEEPEEPEEPLEPYQIILQGFRTIFPDPVSSLWSH